MLKSYARINFKILYEKHVEAQYLEFNFYTTSQHSFLNFVYWSGSFKFMFMLS